MSGERTLHPAIQAWYDAHGREVEELARTIWAHPEPAMEEFTACRAAGSFLEAQGFSVKTYHCRDEALPPNTVEATAGSGFPVIGIYGEYDALPGLGQEAVPRPAPIPGCGHGCGHSLMTPAGASAAAAAWRALQAENLPGTIRFIACPAEETGEGKAELLRHGAFDGLDCCLAWHPMGHDLTPFEGELQALASYRFEFFGQAAHAAQNPDMGRSALDAAELMNVGVQYLREHVPPDVRIHYSYLSAGDKPNIVPAYAALHYMIRARDTRHNEEVIARVKAIARGAAMMAGVETRDTLLSSTTETRIVHSFNRFLYEAAQAVPPLRCTEEEEAFARELYERVCGPCPPGFDPLPRKLVPPAGRAVPMTGSTDAGPLTKMVPTARLFGLGVVRDIPGHHWGVTACAGSSIGRKAALFAGKAMAQCALETARHPERIALWKEELKEAENGTSETG